MIRKKSFSNGLVICVLIIVSACSEAPVSRDPDTMDTGLPLTPGMAAYDVLHYTLRHDIRIASKTIAGSATIRFEALEAMDRLELDFDANFIIEAVEDVSGSLSYERDSHRLYVNLASPLAVGDLGEVTVRYHGSPLEAERAPWEGGFVWAETPSGKPWIATAIQGEGCDIWWPCKDHPGDEAEGFDLYFTVPPGLMVASNGVLKDVMDEPDGRRTFHWRTEVATASYAIALNVAPYILIEGSYTSTNGTEIPVEFWAIEDHEAEARELFEREFMAILAFFKRRVGPYPWGQEKMGVAETPHLGMEHQTINAYGNQFKRDDYGFDWLLHHEFAHEWFGNQMTNSNWSDMWLHEGFAAYMQPVYTREILGDAAFLARMYKTYLGIKSCQPVAPRAHMTGDQIYNAEQGGPGGDIYSKGAWILHSLRYVMGDDAFWRSVTRLVYDTSEPEKLAVPILPIYRTTDDFLAIASEEAGQDLSWFFEVYLRHAPLPLLTLDEGENGMTLAWQTAAQLPFPMPLPVRLGDDMVRIEMPGGKAFLSDISLKDVQIDPFMQILRSLPMVATCEERALEENS